MAKAQTQLQVDGHDIAITNLEKVLYPATGTTKGEVLAYYATVAPALIPHARSRPATRRRWPDGVLEQSFYEKNLPSHAPDWIARAKITHRSRVVQYPLINNQATLIWLVQGAALELHTPQWIYEAEHAGPAAPDRLVIDLDPGAPAGLVECAEVALAARELLEADGVEAIPVTSGSKGLQLYAAVTGVAELTDTNQYANALAQRLADQLPEQVISHMARSDRAGKVFVDWSQTNQGKTTIAPYSLRGRLTPTVAAPRSWDEIAAGDLSQLDYREVMDRLDKFGDLLTIVEPERT